MPHATLIQISPEQEQELGLVVSSGSSPQRLVQRALVVLLASEGKTNGQIGAELGMSRQKAGRWRERYLDGGLAGLAQDRPGRGRKPMISAQQRAAVVRKTTGPPPQHADPLEQAHHGQGHRAGGHHHW